MKVLLTSALLGMLLIPVSSSAASAPNCSISLVAQGAGYPSVSAYGGGTCTVAKSFVGTIRIVQKSPFGHSRVVATRNVISRGKLFYASTAFNCSRITRRDWLYVAVIQVRWNTKSGSSLYRLKESTVRKRCR